MLAKKLSWFGFLLKGAVTVLDENQLEIATLYAGSIIGEMALFESGERNATLIGRDGTERGVIGVMRFDQLDEIWNCYPEISYKLLNAIATDAILKLRSSLDAETKKKRKTKTNHPSTSETCDNMEDNRNGRRSSIPESW